MQDSAVQTARALFDAMTAHDLSLWERKLAPSFKADYPGAPTLDRSAARAYNAPFLAAFPDLKFVVTRTVTQGSTVVIEGEAGGTFSEPLVTPEGTFPPNGQKGSVHIVLIAQLEAGLIVHERTVWDRLSLFTQLGLLGGPTG